MKWKKENKQPDGTRCKEEEEEADAVTETEDVKSAD
jgi:hypothetical protein